MPRPSITMPNLKRFKKFDKLEKKFMEMSKDPARLNEFWEILDMNGNNKVSLAEIDKLVVYSYPQLNNKKALMRVLIPKPMNSAHIPIKKNEHTSLMEATVLPIQKKIRKMKAWL